MLYSSLTLLSQRVDYKNKQIKSKDHIRGVIFCNGVTINRVNFGSKLKWSIGNTPGRALQIRMSSPPVLMGRKKQITNGICLFNIHSLLFNLSGFDESFDEFLRKEMKYFDNGLFPREVIFEIICEHEKSSISNRW